MAMSKVSLGAAWVLMTVACFMATVNGQICCVPDQFHSHVIYDVGSAFLLSNSFVTYSNTSGRFIYDATNQRSVFNITGDKWSPGIPPSRVSSLAINVNGTTYTISGSTCVKTQQPFSPYCLPDSAARIGTGYVGNNQGNVSIYSYTVKHVIYQVVVSMDSWICTPLQMTTVDKKNLPQGGYMSTVALSDITPGVPDPSVFDIPPSCNKQDLDFVPDGDFVWAKSMAGLFFH